VAAKTFGKLFSYPIDGVLFAQPLYVQGLERVKECRFMKRSDFI
jgi:hypothetical protein